MYNKSGICRKANEFIKEGYTKSEAFKKAWGLTKARTAEEMTLAEKARLGDFIVFKTRKPG